MFSTIPTSFIFIINIKFLRLRAGFIIFLELEYRLGSDDKILVSILQNLKYHKTRFILDCSETRRDLKNNGLTWNAKILKENYVPVTLVHQIKCCGGSSNSSSDDKIERGGYFNIIFFSGHQVNGDDRGFYNRGIISKSS